MEDGITNQGGLGGSCLIWLLGTSDGVPKTLGSVVLMIRDKNAKWG